MNRGAELSLDAEVALALERSLSQFVLELQGESFSERCVDLEHLRQNRFFFDSVRRRSKASLAVPLVLKSYTLDGERYRVSLAFLSGKRDETTLEGIVELQAVPHLDGYRFYCPFDERTRDLCSEKIGNVIFHHAGNFDRERAEEFSRFREWFDQLTGAEELSTLDYYCFPSLNDLLVAHGLVYDVGKCNELGKDLGFLDGDGRRFVTGTGDERYIFGYVENALGARVEPSSSVYWPYVVGMATCLGGYGLSGDSLDDLARQFRDALRSDPQLDFLAEFRKGRGASINRHFSFYVMCAFLCQEIISRHGFEAALCPVNSGGEGERFFEDLRSLLGIDESIFHDTILSLIGVSS